MALSQLLHFGKQWWDRLSYPFQLYSLNEINRIQGLFESVQIVGEVRGSNPDLAILSKAFDCLLKFNFKLDHAVLILRLNLYVINKANVLILCRMISNGSISSARVLSLIEVHIILIVPLDDTNCSDS